MKKNHNNSNNNRRVQYNNVCNCIYKQTLKKYRTYIDHRSGRATPLAIDFAIQIVCNLYVQGAATIQSVFFQLDTNTFFIKWKVEFFKVWFLILYFQTIPPNIDVKLSGRFMQNNNTICMFNSLYFSKFCYLFSFISKSIKKIDKLKTMQLVTLTALNIFMYKCICNVIRFNCSVHNKLIFNNALIRKLISFYIM